MPFFWLIILIESWISRERELIIKLDKTKPIVSYIQDLKNASPKITWEVECYHYETKRKMIPYINADGDTFFREECFKEKITTHTESQVQLKARYIFIVYMQVGKIFSCHRCESMKPKASKTEKGGVNPPFHQLFAPFIWSENESESDIFSGSVLR